MDVVTAAGCLPVSWVGALVPSVAAGADFLGPLGSGGDVLPAPELRWLDGCIEVGDAGGDRRGGVVVPSMGLPPRRGGLGGGDGVEEPGEPTLARLRAGSLSVAGVIQEPSGSAAGAREMADSTAIESSSSGVRWRGVDVSSSIIGRIPWRV